MVSREQSPPASLSPPFSSTPGLSFTQGILLLSLIFGDAGAASSQEATQPTAPIEVFPIREAPKPGVPEPVRGEILIGFRDRVSPGDPEVASLLEGYSLEFVRENPDIAVGLYRLPNDVPLLPILAELEAHPEIEFAEPHGRLELTMIPNDLYYDDFGVTETDLQAWAFDGLGSDRNLNALEAWDVTTGRSDVVIAIVDSGIDLDHPDLAANLWTNSGEVPGNGIDDDQNGYTDDVNGWDFYFGDNDPNPDLGDGIDNDSSSGADSNVFHGTFAASCAGGVGDNGEGVAGAAWTCRLMALKVFTDDGGASTLDIADAITYAANNGADIVNLSLGGGFSSTIQSAVNYSWGQGVVHIASAGNSNTASAQYPASLAHVVSVGAGDSGSVIYGGSLDIDGRASFSQYGTSAVDVVAPGSKLIAAGVLSVANGNPGSPTYFVSSGTSFSAPLVSGLAALILSRAKDLGTELSPDDVEEILQGTAQDLPDDPNDSPDGGANWDHHGRVDFAAALAAVPEPTPNQSPVADAGSDIDLDCRGAGGAEVSLDGTGSEDPDEEPLTYLWSIPGVSLDDPTSATPTGVFPTGTTVATLTVTDGEDASDSDTVTVVVVADTSPPNLTCPADREVECLGSEGAEVEYSALATDDCDSSLEVTFTPPSGSTFPLGTTMVTGRATDAAGNTTSCTFSISIEDTTAPEISCPENLSSKIDDPEGAVVSFEVEAFDGCDDSPVLVCVPGPGSLFPVGTTEVTCTATDASGNSTECSFTVTLLFDEEPPSIQCPGTLERECPSEEGVVVQFEVTAVDNCDDEPVVQCEPPSGSLFAPGSTEVFCSATDRAGNRSECSFLVLVLDRTAPVLECPSEVTRECTSSEGTVIEFEVSVEDACDPSPDLFCEPPSGSAFPLGSTSVICTAVDASGNSRECEFTVTIRDTTPPEIECPEDRIVTSGGGAEVEVYFELEAFDACDPSVDVVCEPPSGSLFPLGETTVQCHGTDAAGNRTDCAFIVSVVLDPLSCRAGNVNAGAGPVVDVLFANESPGDPEERRVVLDRDDSLSLCIEPPPSTLEEAGYMMVLWVGEPDESTLQVLPDGTGVLCMPLPFDGSSPLPRARKIAQTLEDSDYPFDEKWPGPRTSKAPHKLLDLSRVGRPIIVFLQGVIEDPDSSTGKLAVTNGIQLVVE